MPQEFHVLQCHKCKTFQVQQVKKISKWSCKLCAEKQSVLRVYGRGSGADCRRHVQSLNTLRCEQESKHDNQMVSARSVEEADVHLKRFQIDSSEVEENIQNNSSSKWEKYVEPMINEDGGTGGREDDCLYTTDRTLYNTVIEQYKNNKRDSYKQYQPYPRERSKTDGNSRWKNLTLNNTVDFSEIDESSDFSMKRLSQACLTSQPAKGTKWDNFLGDQNEGSQESNFEKQPYRTVSTQDVYQETKIVKPNFNLLDSFLDEECKELVSTNTKPMVDEHSIISPGVINDHVALGKSKISSPAQSQNVCKAKILNSEPQKKSKWEAFTNTIPDEDSEYYIPEDNSPDFDNLDLDPEPRQPFYVEDAQCFDRNNFDFSQSRNVKDCNGTSTQTAKSQVFSNVASYALKSNSKKALSTSGIDVFNASKSNPKTLFNNVPDTNILPAKKVPSIPGSEAFDALNSEPKMPVTKVNPSKSISMDALFQVYDFDETEFEFVI